MSCLPRLNWTVLVLALATSFAYAGETTNKIGITMVDIPAGSFQMGSCKQTTAMAEENKKRSFLGQAPISANCSYLDADAANNETPQHRVNVKAFQMGKTEVTLGQFKKFITAAGRSDLVSEQFMQANTYGDSAPVVWVRWRDAQDFIKWLNQIDGGGYRLPSEAEWEYACRAGGSHIYCGGNDPRALGWYGLRRPVHLLPVAGKQPNAFGLYDMSGNASEWVQDCWNDSYRGAPTDGSVWTSGDCDLRGVRGGTSFYEANHVRAASRDYISLSQNYYGGLGFRLARSLKF